MDRIITTCSEDRFTESEAFVERVFTESEDAESGAIVRGLLHEIREKKYYVPELDLIMTDGEGGEIIGLATFSRFHLEGRYEDELLIFTPMAVKTELQRQHISKELIEFGINRGRELGYKAIIVEGNPLNYRPRGFVTSVDFGIYAHESVGLPAPECLMVQELVPGALEHIHGVLDYRFYEHLR